MVTCMVDTDQSSEAMILTMENKWVPIFHWKGFELPVSSQYWEIIGNVNIFLCFFPIILHIRSSYQLIQVWWHHMATRSWVNIGSGNGLFPDGTKPLPEPMLTDHQWSPVTFIVGQFCRRCLNHHSIKSVWKLHIYNFIQISQGPMS